MATQNPVEHEGTYRLPEAQLDRFLLKINVDYPTLEQETEILMRFHKNNDRLDLSAINTVITPAQLAKFKKLAHQVIVENHLIEYIAKIVQQTRESADLFLGASPRASLAVLSCVKSYEAMQGRDFVSPEDIQYITPFVLKHRIIATPEKEMEGISNEENIKDLIASVEVPR
ncbi:MAG TPA: magnesium chelatase, partial [Flavobacteriales bacterium]|nr:magnesium chelatase [Flavobacteriales bacterium]